jgi:Tol biopolymer transport system component
MLKRVHIAALLIGFLAPQIAFAQFGKNKVSYTSKDWKVLQTEHVDIYYYPSERNLVAFVAPIVESTYLEFSSLFDIEFRDRLPLVFYSSHYDFQQTNIIRLLISQYTGGFTDLIKGRIAIPMTGSLWELRHVIRHEMVHAFMLEKLAIVMKEANRFTYSHPPLWFVEGMAEYFAAGSADTRSHMFIRDALMHGKLPNLTQIWRIQGSFMMYKEGEAVVRYIATNFGDEAVIRILENWWMADKFTFVLKLTINMDLYELDDAFMKGLKRRYYPEILHRTFAPDVATQLTRPRTFHSRPTVGTDGDGNLAVYTLFAQDGMINIGRIAPNDFGQLAQETLIEGGRSTSFESIPAFRSKIEAHGDTLVFVAKRHGQDAIYIWDTAKRKTIDRLTFPGLSVISSPTMSSQMDKVAFGAIDTTGTMDIFLFDRTTRRLERLTQDPYAEEDPDFHPFADIVLFSSDRCQNGDSESQGIYEIDINTKVVTALTCGDQSDSHPDWLPEGDSFLFTSDRDGVFNIYSFDYRTRMVKQQTNVIGGVTSPSALPGGEGFVATGYYQSEFHIFQFPLNPDAIARPTTVARVDSANASWVSKEPQEYSYVTRDYKQKLGLDFAAAGVAIDPDFGSLGNGGQIVLSDILGNHQYYLFFGNTSQVNGNFFRNLNVGVNYLNLSHRLNYSLGVFHLTSVTGDFFTAYRAERRYGVATGLRYPFSKFSRLDGSLVFRFVEREADFGLLAQQKSFIASAFLTYAVDNTLWTLGGPLKGWRYYATVGHTFDFRDRGFDNTTVQLDLRKYFKITRRIVLAERLITRHSYGGDFQIFYLGGPWDLRGYNFRQFFGRSTYLINSELRFPLIDRFAVALPFGTLETPLMRGSLFFDAGRANRYIIDTQWLGTVGAGVELNLGYAPLIRVNFTRATDFRIISTKTDWELFIGFNY